jgi:NTE family protein
MMAGLASQLRKRYWLDFTVPKVGLIGGTKIHQLMMLLTHSAEFSQSRIPLAIVSTELVQRRLITFTTGLIADAVRASISIPGVFVPFIHNGGVYVDGGVLERVPVMAARSLGGEVILGVDVASNPRSVVPETILDVILQSLDIMQRPLLQVGVDAADVWIEPDLGNIGTSHFQRAAEAEQIGYQATIDKMVQIKHKLIEKGASRPFHED